MSAEAPAWLCLAVSGKRPLMCQDTVTVLATIQDTVNQWCMYTYTA